VGPPLKKPLIFEVSGFLLLRKCFFDNLKMCRRIQKAKLKKTYVPWQNKLHLMS